MLQSDLITPSNTMSHHQPPPVLLMDELLLSSTHLMSEAQPSSASYHPLPPPPSPPPAKKKRSLPGHPDPGAEVIALSPNSLLATNRFMCEICHKGFQRDQNLQLHRRGHNLPWKLKQRAKDEVVRKKVYVCPEPGCVHNDPARALGDLTGIKKHFYRKHGEKKWKCDKCSKKYAVQSDWKAHSKTCGTKEYRCDCGTLFSRRDSFITHRAFCDALVEDTARALTSNPFLPPPQPQQQQQEAAATHHDPHQSLVATSSSPHQNMLFLPNPDPQVIPQQEQPHPSESLQTHIPNLTSPWLQAPPLLHSSSSSPALLFSHDQLMQQPLQNPSHVVGGPNYPSPPPPPQPHLSATALLQKAAQLGAIISSNTASSTSPLPVGVVTAQPPSPMTAGFGLNLSSYEQQQEMGNPTLGFFAQGCGGGPGSSTFGGSDGGGGAGGGSFSSSSSSSSLLRDLMMMKSMASFDGDNMPFGNGGISDGLTRDFLGLRPLINQGDHDIVNLSTAGLGDTTNAASSSSQERKMNGNSVRYLF